MSSIRKRTVHLSLVTCVVFAACARDAVAPITSSATFPTPSASADKASTSDDADGQQSGNGDSHSARSISFAVIGDSPYGLQKFAEFPSLVEQINRDSAVEFVVHVGDIKAGKNAPCTDSYLASVRAMFDGFADPLVYTPGDNEWTDCHQAGKNNGLYTPTERLEKLRSLFFPVAGQTLGERTMTVVTQGGAGENGAYVENVSFIRSRIVFGTLNIPGSNNDGVSWGTPLPANAGQFPSQANERSARARANAAWLDAIFTEARGKHVEAVVLAFQADMWDVTEPSLSGFDALVEQIGRLASALGKPVLLLEGDSHTFSVDHPFSATSPLRALHASTPVAENVTRIVVEGSDKGRTEYLRIAVDPKGTNAPVFTWDRIPLM